MTIKTLNVIIKKNSWFLGWNELFIRRKRGNLGEQFNLLISLDKLGIYEHSIPNTNLVRFHVHGKPSIVFDVNMKCFEKINFIFVVVTLTFLCSNSVVCDEYDNSIGEIETCYKWTKSSSSALETLISCWATCKTHCVIYHRVNKWKCHAPNSYFGFCECCIDPGF